VRVALTPEQRAHYKKFHPDLDRTKLEQAGKVPIDDRNLERLSNIGAHYLYDVAAEFEPPRAWSWLGKAPVTKAGKPRLTREMEKRRRKWLVDEVREVWHDCGGKGSGAYVKPAASEYGKDEYVQPLPDLITELLDQFGASREQRSPRSLYRVIRPEKNRRGR
jgi:hypothetical protein